MKRAVRNILFILLSAMLLNLAVAWTCAAKRPPQGGWTHSEGVFWTMPQSESHPPGYGYRQLGRGWTKITLYGAREHFSHRVFVDRSLPSWIDVPQDQSLLRYTAIGIRVGWPARCFCAQLSGSGEYVQRLEGEDWPLDEAFVPDEWMTWWTAVEENGRPTALLTHARFTWDQWIHALVLDDSEVDATQHRMLPYGVVPLAMLVNLLFWSLPGVVVLALAHGFRQSRRAMRRRAGLCSQCGYPARGRDICTECGSSLIQRRKSHGEGQHHAQPET